MSNPNYPASTLSAASSLTIENGNTWHQILNGGDDETFEVDDGTIPSVRKSIKDNFYYKDPIDWVENNPVTEFNQLVKFTDGTLWVAPTARANNPILMGATPVGDDLFKVAPIYNWGQELIAVARGLNVENDAVVLGVAGQVITVEKKYIYNHVDQNTWGTPTLNSYPENIISVTDNALVTNGGNYKLIPFLPRFSNEISVKDTGAVGDGVTDDTAAFKATEGYDHVFIPSGEYLVTEEIAYDGKVRITGENKPTTIIRSTIGSGVILSVNSDSVVEHITIDGVDRAGKDTVALSSTDVMVRCVFNDINIKNVEKGISHPTAAFLSSLSNIWCDNVGYGLSVIQFNGASVKNFYTTNFDHIAIKVNKSKGVTLTNVTHEHGGEKGISLTGCLGVAIDGVYSEGVAPGTWVEIELNQQSGVGSTKANSIKNCYFAMYSTVAGPRIVTFGAAGETNITDVVWWEPIAAQIPYYIDTEPYPGNDSKVYIDNWTVGTEATAPTTIPVSDKNTNVTIGAGVDKNFFGSLDSGGRKLNEVVRSSSGTWTPVLDSVNGASGQTYTVQRGRYVRVGNMVTATFRAEKVAGGTATGDANISGLPFPAATPSAQGEYDAAVAFGRYSNLGFPVSSLHGYANGGGNVINVLHKDGSTTSDSFSQGSIWSANAVIIGTITYETE